MVPLATFVIGTGILVVLGFTAVMFLAGILLGAHPEAEMGGGMEPAQAEPLLAATADPAGLPMLIPAAR